jgi:hypothetical protein
MPSRLAAVVSGAALVGVVACTSAFAAGPTPGAGRQAWARGLHFNSHGVSRVTVAELGKSWHQGCPVAPTQLRALQVGFWGFDGARHTGVLVVNADAVPAIRTAFAQIAKAHFPIRLMEPVAAYGGNDNRSMAHDNTSAFNCRLAVSDGPKSWSEHAYGEAVDIDPFENPYKLDGKVLPPAATTYANRSKHRRGMIFAGGPVVAAFDSVGWGWGGRWTSSPDYQHFSVNGR